MATTTIEINSTISDSAFRESDQLLAVLQFVNGRTSTRPGEVAAEFGDIDVDQAATYLEQLLDVGYLHRVGNQTYAPWTQRDQVHLITKLLALGHASRQFVLDFVAERTGQRAGRATLIERHAVTPAKAFANM